ncbi:hypothetical protein BD770DRAFT_385676 [Pilaira anomala]|nr:hypothetical protein BD770DRAFT_385676 [Pilaira anomala]
MLTPVYKLHLLLIILIFIQNCTGFGFTFDVQLKAGTTWWNGYARNILVYERDGSIVCTSKDGNRVHPFSDVFDYTCGQYHLYWDGNQNTANGKFYTDTESFGETTCEKHSHDADSDVRESIWNGINACNHEAQTCDDSFTIECNFKI